MSCTSSGRELVSSCNIRNCYIPVVFLVTFIDSDVQFPAQNNTYFSSCNKIKSIYLRLKEATSKDVSLYFLSVFYCLCTFIYISTSHFRPILILFSRTRVHSSINFDFSPTLFFPACSKIYSARYFKQLVPLPFFPLPHICVFLSEFSELRGRQPEPSEFVLFCST